MENPSRRNVLKGAVALAAAGALSGLTGKTPASASVTGKVARSGDKLMLNGSPFRIMGLSMWPMAIRTWCEPPNFDGRLNGQLNTVLSNIRTTAPHVNAIRVWFYQQFALHNGVRDWSGIDSVLNIAANHGFRVIADFEDSWSYERTGSQSPELGSSWYNGGYKSTVLAKEKEPYRRWVKQVVTRYANDPRVLMWELVSEPNGIIQSFASDMSTMIKGIDPMTPICCGEAGGLPLPILSLPNIDIASYHYYSVYGQTNYQATANNAASAGKPWYMAEYGIPTSAGTANRANTIQNFLPTMLSTGPCAGFMYWQYAERGGDQFDITSASDPALPVIDNFA
jgi:hypothetical protein